MTGEDLSKNFTMKKRVQIRHKCSNNVVPNKLPFLLISDNVCSSQTVLT